MLHHGMRVVLLGAMAGALCSGCLLLSHEQASEGARADRDFCADGTEVCTAEPGDGDRICYYADDDTAGNHGGNHRSGQPALG